METLEFIGFPKMARLSREIIISEKIDGTNAQILITEDGQMLVGSKTRWITPKDDNHGFAKWIKENKEEILKLGVGRHFGEWWGSGINRGYGLLKGEKRFSLFNTIRWCEYGKEPQRRTDDNFGVIKMQDVLPKCVSLVPVLYTGMFDTTEIQSTLNTLIVHGSYASPGFMNPEGIVIFHVAGNVGFKKTIKNDDVPKSLVCT